MTDRPVKPFGMNPFPDRPPVRARASLYHDRFSTRVERRDSGAWWVRTRTADLDLPLRHALS